MRGTPRAAAATLLTAALAACGGGRDGSASSSNSPATAAGTTPDTRVDARPKGGVSVDAPDTTIHASAKHVGGRTWVISGTSKATDNLEVSVEDGRYVLYGPETVPVKDGRFRAELKLPATDRPTALRAFVGDAAGRHQAVVVLRP